MELIRFVTFVALLFPSRCTPLQNEAEATKPTNCARTNPINAFSFDLQKVISEKDNGNMVFSPYSIYSALAMLSLGANGMSKKQITSAMKWTSDENHHFNSLKTMRESFTSVGEDAEAKLNVANNGWLASDFNILESFRNETARYFGVNFERLDFNKAKDALDHVNNWVRDNTGKRITELFPPGSFDSRTKLVLANAIYFKGQWKYPFKKKFTRPMTFFREDGERTENVKYMYQSGAFMSSRHGTVQLLELPYGQNEKFSMLFAKPLHPSEVWSRRENPLDFYNISRLSNEVNDTLMNEWMQSLRKRKYDIYVPRFTLKKSVKLKEELKRLGITEVFSGAADLSKITGSQDLFVSAAEHKSYIEVDEEGTRAAAATGLGFMLKSLPPRITLNRPFLFFILSKPCNSIIFAGRVVEPGA